MQEIIGLLYYLWCLKKRSKVRNYQTVMTSRLQLYYWVVCFVHLALQAVNPPSERCRKTHSNSIFLTSSKLLSWSNRSCLSLKIRIIIFETTRRRKLLARYLLWVFFNYSLISGCCWEDWTARATCFYQSKLSVLHFYQWKFSVASMSIKSQPSNVNNRCD